MARVLPSLFRWLWGYFGGKCPRTIRPRVQHDQPFLVVAHRGSPLKQIENTLPSFQQAMDDGANALELDLCFTADQQVIVWHDWDPNGVEAQFRRRGLEPSVRCVPYFPTEDGFRRSTHELNLAQIREHFGYAQGGLAPTRLEAHIPTLDEFMQWATTEPRLRTVFFDIKTPPKMLHLLGPMLEQIDQCLGRHRPAFRIVYETLHRPVLRTMKALRPGNDYTLDLEMPLGVLLFPSRYSAARRAVRWGNAIATINRPYSWTIGPWMTFRRVVHHDLGLRDRHNARQRGRRLEYVLGFTINDEQEMRCLLFMGIDGIFTDKPDLLAEVARGMGRKM